MKTKWTNKFLSFLLVLCLLIPVLTAFPSIAIEKNNEPVGESSPGAALVEDIEKRDAYTKQYMRPDGSYLAVIYPEQIHTYQNGIWQDVDNSLTLSQGAQKRYQNGNGDFAVSFAENASSSDDLVKIKVGDYELSWTVAAISADRSVRFPSDAKGEVENRVSGSRKSQNDPVGEWGDARSSVSYRSVFGASQNVELRYSISQYRLEEDIILHERNSINAYRMTVSMGTLTARLEPDRSVSFLDEGGEVQYKIGIPWMSDSAGAVSEDIEVTLQQTEGAAVITYTPNRAWLDDAERVYPVLIDPSVTNRQYSSNYMDTYVYTGDSPSVSRSTQQSLYVGKQNNIEYVSYIQIRNFPTILEWEYVQDASFSVVSQSSALTPMALSYVTTPFSAETLCYANQPSYDYTIDNSPDMNVLNGRTYYTFDMTEALGCYEIEHFANDFWYDCTGFRLKAANSARTTLYSADSAYSAYYPIVYISYTYSQSSALADNAVYQLINKTSQKALTCGSGAGANVYQSTNSNSVSQSFRFHYQSDSDCYTISPYVDSNGDGSTIGFPFSQTNAPAGSLAETPVNVSKTANGALQEDQEWLIVPANDGQNGFMVVSRADPTLALTACGTSDGSNGGTLPTSSGNVYLSARTSSMSGQIWYLESGGERLYANGGTRLENGGVLTRWSAPDSLRLNLPIPYYDATITYYSSNPYVATINQATNLLSILYAGITDLTAEVEVDGIVIATYSMRLIVRVADGVYRISQNRQTERALSVAGGSLAEEGSFTHSSTGSGWQNTRSALFKIVYLGDGRYSVRTMLDSLMGLTVTDGYVRNCLIGYQNDATVASNQQWIIDRGQTGYTLSHISGVNREAVTLSETAAESVFLSSYDASDSDQMFQLTRTTQAFNGVTMRNQRNYLVVDDSIDRVAALYSSEFAGNREEYRPVYSATANATITQSGRLTGVSSGYATCTAAFVKNNVTIATASCVIDIIPFREGYIYLRNRQSNMFVRDGGNNDFMEQWGFSGAETEFLYLSYAGNTSYYIMHVQTGKYLTTPYNYQTIRNIKRENLNSAIASRQQWKFTRNQDGSYQIQALYNLNTELVMAANANGEGANIQNDYRSSCENRWKWDVAIVCHTPLCAQQGQFWCWLACAQMVAKADGYDYYSQAYVLERLYVVYQNYISPYTGALFDFIGVEAACELFSRGEKDYYMSNSALSDYQAISKIKNGKPIIAGISNGTTGHAVVIFGYYYDSSESRYVFITRDPAPQGGGSYGFLYQSGTKYMYDPGYSGATEYTWTDSVYR